MSKASAPIVVDLGSASRKRLKKLRQGSGKLEAEVRDVVEQIRIRLGDKADSKELVPVVVIYSRKSKKRGSIIDFIP